MDFIDSTRLRDAARNAASIKAERDREDEERAATENLRRFDCKKERDEEVRNVERKWATKLAELEVQLLHERRELKAIRDNEDMKLNEQRLEVERDYRESLRRAMLRHKADDNGISKARLEGEKRSERENREKQASEYKRVRDFEEGQPEYLEGNGVANISLSKTKSVKTKSIKVEPMSKNELARLSPAKIEPVFKDDPGPLRKKVKLSMPSKTEKGNHASNIIPGFNPAPEPKSNSMAGFVYDTKLFPVTGLDTPEWFWFRSIRHLRKPTKEGEEDVFRWGPEGYGTTNYSLRLLDGVYTPWVMGTPMRLTHKAWMIEAKHIYKTRYNIILRKIQVTQKDNLGRETDIWFEFREPHGLQNFLASLPNKVILEELDTVPPGWGFRFDPPPVKKCHQLIETIGPWKNP